MKTQSEIEKRLQKLRKRYRQKYVQERVGRRHQNCVHNYEHAPRGEFKYSRSHDVELAPRRQTTLLVVQPDQPVRICTYGSTGKDWNGDVCDTDEKASGCPWFKASRLEDEVGAEFDSLMSDVEFVFDNYRDVATLQWVLDVRVVTVKPSLVERFLSLFKTRNKELPAPKDPEVPEGIWDADNQDPRP